MKSELDQKENLILKEAAVIAQLFGSSRYRWYQSKQSILFFFLPTLPAIYQNIPKFRWFEIQLPLRRTTLNTIHARDVDAMASKTFLLFLFHIENSHNAGSDAYLQ